MKQLSKLLALALSFSLLFTALPACAQEDPLLEHALSLSSLLGEMAQNETYFSLFSTSEEIAALIRSWSEVDYDFPSAAYRITLPSSFFTLFLSLADSSSAELPDSLMPQLYKRLTASIPTMINGRNGVTALAASSLLTAQTAFPAEEEPGYALYFLFFDGGAPVACAFYPEESGIVGASACFLADESFRAPDGLSQLNIALRQAGVSITCEEVPLGTSEMIRQ